MNTIGRLISDTSLIGVWTQYIAYVNAGSSGRDGAALLREQFGVVLHFPEGADFAIRHPMMDSDLARKYVNKVLSVDIDADFGSSYGYRLFRSYGIDQVEMMADRLAMKPESKAACANLLHPPNSLMETDAGMRHMACLTCIQGIVREARLHFWAHFRSQNVWNSYGNFAGIRALQEMLIEKLGSRDVRVAAGDITVFVVAAHLYEHDFGRVACLLSHSPEGIDAH